MTLAFPVVAATIGIGIDMNNGKLNWGIIGTGAIAGTYARNLSASTTGVLGAVASRTEQAARAFASELGVQRGYGNYPAILQDPQIDAVYIAVPHPFHAEWTINAARAGKHILVEKPIGMNQSQAAQMIDTAKENAVFLMEAFMYRCHPQTARLIELIRNRAIGEVRSIQATFSFKTDFDARARLFDPALGGGGILDVGCYPVSMARLIAGVATGTDFADPIDLNGSAHLGKTGVDEWAVASMRFPGDILAQLATGISLDQENVVRIFGSEGQILLPNPWVANRTSAEQGLIIIQRNDQPAPSQIRVDASVTSFTYEADVAGRAILCGKKQPPAPAMTWDDSLGNIRTLDRWREAVGLKYDADR